ncbi:MAG: PQQ-dependent sugar dehydrogenase [Gammaproteobacteria bacterium]|uniref:PQQ-dependent sugar dehydrogenase n=1 Tax=Limnobacter sp. TaxID=2003368 RepID=UPI001D308D6B|nr:PQQ-dependent sugar dehydrogenase [Limnobacter sp.]MBU0784711.1 PQQ-dependent sugar dehydrogenase [Gammaproteobacteria bacterium]MBU0848096.1 PQQ-dependent sugar dehydrogenase [Gammaproteobacteria bacterium]MBU1267635.1 PQQ-dependent sugar dehydrogenase [Gammaproteobacteria bacterium]MBU1529996.1 PQQ-dependent sugar dehydrogenase [Gammaproteobacteria bacterium]MBU1779867.1 PQQ-dependent sugar dehydrogenase [Gammaproteobacteria bacterium]
MNRPTRMRTTLASFLIALLIGVVSGTLVQTQINLLALQNLGVVIDLQTRIASSFHDLGNFSPVYAVLFGGSFVASQAVALLFTRFTAAIWRTFWCTFGAALGLWLTFKVVDMFAPMPVLIASTRTVGGMLSMLAAAAVSGLVFAKLSKPGKAVGMPALALLLGVGLALPQGDAIAQGSKPYKIETVVEGLESPWSMAFLPDGRALITEKPGRLRLLGTDGKLQAKPLSGVPQVFYSGQAGLFDVLPATDFAQSQQIFLSYACGNRSANHTCVSSATLGANGLESVKEIFRSQMAKSGSAHFGGRLVWLPDNTLVITLGDGYSYREEAQNLSNHLGKIVRINADGSVPKNNPFVGKPGAKPEIYSYGHRNVQGLAYDAATKQLISHEHGPRGGDEVNVITPGINYGWPKATYGIDYSGAQISPYNEYEGTQQPAIYWVPSIAPSGITVYNGDMFPQWKGSLLVGALKAKQVSRVVLKGNKAAEVDVLFKEVGERIRDIRTGPDGAIYLLTDNADGRVLRVSAQ